VVGRGGRRRLVALLGLAAGVALLGWLLYDVVGLLYLGHVGGRHATAGS
jgi:hypothetical protein